jgi:hypothetical protein
VLVARRDDFTERDLPVAPLLAAEVLSTSTRRIDVSLKRPATRPPVARRTGSSIPTARA